MKMSEWPKWLKHNFLYNTDISADDSEDPTSWTNLNELDRVENLDEANIVTSKWYESRVGNVSMHKLFLDLDIEHLYVPSSTPGHGHLMINVDLDEKDLKELVALLVKLNVLSPGSLGQLVTRGANSLRLPWIKKAEYQDPMEWVRQRIEDKKDPM